MMFSLPAMPPALDLRPQFHFTAPAGWLNDPNGLVYQGGVYHLFYQHNPFGTNWGNMTWGHAVSKDLVRWNHLPHAIEPDGLGTIYSGSAVIDKGNVSGLGTKAKPAMLCFYTAAGGQNEASKGKPFTQCLAFSTDGRTFTKYSGNPIIQHQEVENRDPKVVWHEDSKKWILALYLTDHRYAFFGSKNLTSWTKLSEYRLEGTDECPDLFTLPVEGEKTAKWIFWGANGNYQIGDFDGMKFVPQSSVLRSLYGNTGYAAQTYSNSPRDRRIQIGWMNNSNFPDCAWNQQMMFPNRLSLRRTTDGLRMAFWPVDEIKRIPRKKLDASEGVYRGNGLFDVEGEWGVPSTGKLTLDVNGISIRFDAQTRRLVAMDKEVELPPSKTLALRVLADRTSLEIYAQKGLYLMPLFHIPKESDPTQVALHSEGTWSGKLQVYELNP